MRQGHAPAGLFAPPDIEEAVRPGAVKGDVDMGRHPPNLRFHQSGDPTTAPREFWPIANELLPGGPDLRTYEDLVGRTPDRSDILAGLNRAMG